MTIAAAIDARSLREADDACAPATRCVISSVDVLRELQCPGNVLLAPGSTFRQEGERALNGGEVQILGSSGRITSNSISFGTASAPPRSYLRLLKRRPEQVADGRMKHRGQGYELGRGE